MWAYIHLILWKWVNHELIIWFTVTYVLTQSLVNYTLKKLNLSYFKNCKNANQLSFLFAKRPHYKFSSTVYVLFYIFIFILFLFQILPVFCCLDVFSQTYFFCYENSILANDSFIIFIPSFALIVDFNLNCWFGALNFHYKSFKVVARIFLIHFYYTCLSLAALPLVFELWIAVS